MSQLHVVVRIALDETVTEDSVGELLIGLGRGIQEDGLPLPSDGAVPIRDDARLAVASLAVEPVQAEADKIRDAVLKLWDDNDAWIPGADYARLAEALGVPHERTQTHRKGGQSRPSGPTRNIDPFPAEVIRKQEEP